MGLIEGIPIGTEYDITLYQGRTFEQIFLVRESDESTPVPLTGWVAEAEMRNRPNGTLVMTFEALIDAAAGQVTIRASADLTDTITRGGSYDVALIKTFGATPIVVPFVQGKVLLDKEVTDVG